MAKIDVINKARPDEDKVYIFYNPPGSTWAMYPGENVNLCTASSSAFARLGDEHRLKPNHPMFEHLKTLILWSGERTEDHFQLSITLRELREIEEEYNREGTHGED